jgi:hypothetical protein
VKLTRRKLAAALVTAAAVPAQTPPQTAPAGDDLNAKRDLMRANAQAVANFSVPMATEPAFKFKA